MSNRGDWIRTRDLPVPNRRLTKLTHAPDRQVRVPGSVHLVPRSQTDAQFTGLLEISPTLARA